MPGEVTILSWRRVDLLVRQGQLLLEVQPHRLVLLLAIAERADQLSVNLLKIKKIWIEYFDTLRKHLRQSFTYFVVGRNPAFKWFSTLFNDSQPLILMILGIKKRKKGEERDQEINETKGKVWFELNWKKKVRITCLPAKYSLSMSNTPSTGSVSET